MPSRRFSIPDTLYWRLVALGAPLKLDPPELIAMWADEAEGQGAMPPRQAEKPTAKMLPIAEKHPAKMPRTPPDKQRPNLSECPDELARIREMYLGKRSFGQIAKETDRPKSTIRHAIAAMKKRGEL